MEEFGGLAGTELEPSPWLEITQERINQFADATSDHQFIHVDPEQSKETAFGGTIAHGFLTLSLLSHLNKKSQRLPTGVTMGINYGSDKVRYLAPVKVNQRIRTRQKVLSVSEKRPGQWLVRTSVTVEIDGENVPALIAEILSMYIVDTNTKEVNK